MLISFQGNVPARQSLFSSIYRRVPKDSSHIYHHRLDWKRTIEYNKKAVFLEGIAKHS